MANVIKAYFGAGMKEMRPLGRRRTTSKCCPGLVTLGGYLDGTMADQDKERVEAHLVECATCRRVVVELYLLLRLRPAPPSPPELSTAAKALVFDGSLRGDSVTQ
ncbi:MAG: zf-HC2 domain-containing protein [Proteobacteria bacterium]|nr:zf-HC2 domain-containing protein [Pseudomonadota bacterium]